MPTSFHNRELSVDILMPNLNWVMLLHLPAVQLSQRSRHIGLCSEVRTRQHNYIPNIFCGDPVWRVVDHWWFGRRTVHPILDLSNTIYIRIVRIPIGNEPWARAYGTGRKVVTGARRADGQFRQEGLRHSGRDVSSHHDGCGREMTPR